MSNRIGKRARTNYYLQAIKNEKGIFKKLKTLILFFFSFLAMGITKKDTKDLFNIIKIIFNRLFRRKKIVVIKKECASLLGRIGKIEGKSRVASEEDDKGFLMHGPYIKFPKGTYRLVLLYNNTDQNSCDWDIFFNGNKRILKSGKLQVGKNNTLEIDFKIDEELSRVNMEFRLFYNKIGKVKAHKMMIKGTKESPKPDISYKNYIKPPSIVHKNSPDPYIKLNDIKRLKSLHNKFKNNRIFIIGNGPSLNKMDLNLLKNEYTYGVNRIYLLFDRIEWKPSFYSAFDIRVVPDNAEEIKSLDIDYKFFSSRYRSLLGEKNSHYWYYDNSRWDDLSNRFEPEVLYSGFGGGGSITHLAIQLAFYMGFEPIYLIGVDASYKVLNTVKQSGPDKFGDGIKLELESTKDDDPNHFDPRYFGKGKKWHNPNVKDMLRGYELIKKAVDKHNRHIYNATVGGKLEVFERVDFESLF